MYGRYEALRLRLPGNIYYRTYKTKDGVLATACLSEPLRKKMADALGLYDMRFEVGYDPYSDQAQQFAEELLPKAEALLLPRLRKTGSKFWIPLGFRVARSYSPKSFSSMNRLSLTIWW